MSYVMTLIWSVLIGGAIAYVLTSMAGEPFNLTATLFLGGVFAITVFIIGEFVLKPEKTDE